MGEPAFDPFALMDEQPLSHRFSVRLIPDFMDEKQRKVWETDDTEDLIEQHREGPQLIGCCGFPLHEVSNLHRSRTDSLETASDNAISSCVSDSDDDSDHDH